MSLSLYHPSVAFRVDVDGKDITAQIRPRLIQLTHTDNRGFEADLVEIDLDDSDGALDLPARGAVLVVSLGWQQSGLVAKGSYTVDEVAHTGTPDVLSIRARSADLRAGLTTQRERSWHDTTVGTIVETIASENDLIPLVHASLATLAVDHLDQTNESSANFLTRLAGLHDAIATVKDGRLLFVPTASGESASGKRLPPVTITRKSGDHHQFTIADRQTYKAVRALYHDVNQALKGEVIWGDTEDGAERGAQAKPATSTPAGQYKALPGAFSTRGKAQRAARVAWKKLKANPAQKAAYVGVKAKYNDRNLGVSGEVAHGQADDDAQRKAAKKTAAKDAEKAAGKSATGIGSESAFERSDDNVKTLRHVYASKANAQRAARAEWRRLQRGVATFSLTLAEGRPELFPETPATVSGFKPQIDSTDWIITRVVNTISGDAGYSQRLEFEIKATEIPD
ncbi:MAG: phage late control D family protein [Proteobacteria bacterium]|nr:phage late control D family protein [Pseudomonadota bacterium]